MVAQISHHILPYFAGFALVAFLYIPVYTSVMEIKVELTAVRRNIFVLRAESAAGANGTLPDTASAASTAAAASAAAAASSAAAAAAIRAAAATRDTRDYDNSVDVKCPKAVPGTDAAANGGGASAAAATTADAYSYPAQAVMPVRPPGPRKWRSADIGKVMRECVDESCFKMLQDTESYSKEVDAAEFERRWCGDEKVIFHMYWDGHMTDRTIMIIRSFLYTQDPECTRMIVWTLNEEAAKCHNASHPPPLSCNGYDRLANRWRARVDFRVFDLEPELARLSAFVNKTIKSTEIAKREGNKVSFSDSLRYTVLANYGGVYIDADVLLLRDFSVLWEHEFAYVWAYHDACNTAVLRLKRQSPVARRWIRAAIDRNYNFHPLYLGSLEHLAKNISVAVLPVLMFDPVWLLNDNGGRHMPPDMCFRSFKDAFRRSCNRTSLDGAFAYHWHNNYRTSIQPGSFMGSWMSFLEAAVP